MRQNITFTPVKVAEPFLTDDEIDFIVGETVKYNIFYNHPNRNIARNKKTFKEKKSYWAS